MSGKSGADPQGRPGYLRVDTVHQGDQEGSKGVYHLNAVDEVTQWQVVGCVGRINEPEANLPASMVEPSRDLGAARRAEANAPVSAKASMLRVQMLCSLLIAFLTGPPPCHRVSKQCSARGDFL